jgi:hypothetical protein
MVRDENGQLRVQMHKSKPMDQDENGAKLQNWYLSPVRVKLHIIKSFVSIKGAYATIKRIVTKIKYVRSQIKNLDF